MECPLIIKYACIHKESQHGFPILFRNIIIGSLGGGATGAATTTAIEWKKYHKRYPNRSLGDFFDKMPAKSKLHIRRGYRVGSAVGQTVGIGASFINLRKLRPGAGRMFQRAKYPTRDAFNILGLDKAMVKRKSEVSVAFRRVIKMVHPDKGGTSGLSRNVKDAYDSIRKTDWYTKLAFLRG